VTDGASAVPAPGPIPQGPVTRGSVARVGVATVISALCGYAVLYLAARDLEPLPGDSAIVPLIVGETSTAIDASRRLLDDGVFVTGFGFPVVPEGTARIRAQISAAHTTDQLTRAADALATALR